MRQPGIFGQLCWDTYTLVVLGFRTAASQAPQTVTKELDQAAVKLLAACRFFTGQVINAGRSSTSSGSYKIVPYVPHSNGRSPVLPKDCTQLCPSYDEIVQGHSPFAMLDGEVLCPMRGMGYIYDQTVETPVSIIQANFIRGGLLLCFASMHNALDMNAGNHDAESIALLLEEGEIALKHEEMRKPSSLNPVNDAVPPPQEPKAQWIYWRFPRDKLAELKVLALSDSATRISTNDTITAFYTQRLTAVRITASRLSRDDSIHCLCAADGRARLNPTVPKGYLGHLAGLAYTEWPAASTVLDCSLAQVASDIRASLEKMDDYYVRSLATLIQSTEDKTTIFYD